VIGGSAASATHSETDAAARSQAGPAALAGLSLRRDVGEVERAARGNRPAAGSAQTAKRGAARAGEQAGRGEGLGCRAESKEEK
jgi:hypothetical protein